MGEEWRPEGEWTLDLEPMEIIWIRMQRREEKERGVGKDSMVTRFVLVTVVVNI